MLKKSELIEVSKQLKRTGVLKSALGAKRGGEINGLSRLNMISKRQKKTEGKEEAAEEGIDCFGTT